MIFSICSCSKYCRQWELITIKSDCPPITYSKAYLPACSTFSGVEAELLFNGSAIELYFNARSLSFPYSSENEITCELTIVIEGTSYPVAAMRLEGGQRLLIAKEAQDLIIEALMNGCSVDIISGHYKATLIPDNFCQVYSKLKALE